MPTVSAEVLEDAVERILIGAGTPGPVARTVAGSLVLSNLKGLDSHGLVRVAQYVGEIEQGLTLPRATPTAEHAPGRIHVDGGRCFGMVAAIEAARIAAAEAHAHGIALVTVANVRHVGRLGETVERAAAEGVVALAFCNANGRVAPFGGRAPILGTNPIAYAIPTGTGRPIVADFSTAAAAEGRVRLMLQQSERVPPGWIIDAGGNPTDDPAALYEGGALLPAGGHKGYALGLLVEILGGVVAGAGCASLGDEPGNGLVLIALYPVPGGVDEVADAVRAVPPAPGAERVLLPGDPEAATEERRRREGIPVPEATWDEFVAVGARYGVAVT
jgi:uncharacterized oxidoreductase